MRIKADLYSGRLFEYWEPKKRDHQTLPVISHRNMKINTATKVSTRHKVTTMMSGDIVTKTKNIRVGTRPVPADGFYEESSQRKNSVLDQHEGRFSVRLGWLVGRVEGPCDRRMAACVYNHHGRAE